MTSLQNRLLDQLMASDLSPWEASLYRTRLYTGSGDGDLVDAWVRRSHASNRERSGVFHGDAGLKPGRTSEALETSTLKSISQAHARLAEMGLWSRRRATHNGAVDGAGTPYETKLSTARRAALEPRVSVARAAIKTLSLHRSPLGPERELALCRIWYRMEGAGDIAATRQEWAKSLGLSVRSAVRYLRDIEAADVGLTLRVTPPLPGSRAKLYVVSLALPNAGELELPTGAIKHAQEMERARAWVAQDEPTTPPAARSPVTSGWDHPSWNNDEEDLPPEFLEDVLSRSFEDEPFSVCGAEDVEAASLPWETV